MEPLETNNEMLVNTIKQHKTNHAKVEELADTIKERGMHHVLSGRIKVYMIVYKSFLIPYIPIHHGFFVLLS